MKAIIIDDELKARNLLRVLIQENCPKINQIFEAKDLLSGVEIIKKENPNIVFLDIEMPEHSGLEILDFIEKESFNFEIIFTTAYSEYAIQAFQLSAIDYLLKPITPIQVKDAVDKTIKFLGKSQISEKLTELKTSLEEANFKKVGLPHENGTKFVNFQDIILLIADGMYTNVHTINNGIILVCKPLRYCVDLLENIKTFFRPHRSYLINLKYIKEYIKNDGGYVIMENGISVSLSRDKKKEFLTIVNNI